MLNLRIVNVLRSRLKTTFVRIFPRDRTFAERLNGCAWYEAGKSEKLQVKVE